ncbi:hypothetical protein BBJ28_00009252 [Nothophytophthora sp. Chile5]|nr:hypothetical protein BBJ28_00009252 [Nothophytophthora sp. Chile5]
MIIPTRFGLKYAPIPTLALEYEDDLKGVADGTGASATSLYVYRNGDATASLASSRKLHIVELPALTPTSETQLITRQLQQDNGRFLAPGVVSEAQLKRLLDRLVQNLQKASPTAISTTERGSDQDSEADEEMETSAMEESVAEASRSGEHELPSQVAAAPSAAVQEAARDSEERDFEESDEEAATSAAVTKRDTTEPQEAEAEDAGKAQAAVAETSVDREERESEAIEDVEKTKALRSEEEVSEEEVQSEDLEYFSEDASDEDSF